MTTRGRRVAVGEGQQPRLFVCLSALILTDRERRCETELDEGVDTGGVFVSPVTRLDLLSLYQ